MMSSKSMADVQIETAETLENIAIISGKIKQELKVIKEIVKENGPLNNSINTCSLTLYDTLKKRGVKVDELLKDDEDNNMDIIQTVPLTVDTITQKLKAFIDN